MKYKNVFKGTFISRPNRFVAYVEICGKTEICHVKNTGRCKEILTPGATVYVEKSDNPERKTKYDVIAVYKGEELINIDSQAPNKVFGEWVNKSDFFDNVNFVKPECKYKNSRFDYYLEADGKKIFVEVKGVTLEVDGIVKFPDAPTQRGVKHINELADCVKNGYDAYIFFIIQMKNCKYFTPNTDTHPEFADALKSAKNQGVKVVALNCNVLPDTLDIDSFVKVEI